MYNNIESWFRDLSWAEFGVYIYIYIYIHLLLYIYIYIYIYIHLLFCIYIYIHIYICFVTFFTFVSPSPLHRFFLSCFSFVVAAGGLRADQSFTVFSLVFYLCLENGRIKQNEDKTVKPLLLHIKYIWMMDKLINIYKYIKNIY